MDQSALPWRMLSRKHGAQLCYTPMFHARLFASDPSYRNKEFTTCPEDRPLIVQFCGNEPDTVLAAAKLVEDKCDAIDLNLGCPQNIAKKGFYGSYLQDEWDLISSIVKHLHENLKVPVTCKIRIFPEVEKTIRYAKMLQDSGCQLLTVHGRTRDQKGHNTGLADWDQIKAVKEALSIPIFANGNIIFPEDIERCLQYTGVDGVMTAEGNLYNPAIFYPSLPLAHEMAADYLDLVEKYPCSPCNVRGHMFKIFKPMVQVHTRFRKELGCASGIENIIAVSREMIEVSKKDYEVAIANGNTFNPLTDREDIPHWYCQPYLRPEPEQPTENSHKRVAAEPLEKLATEIEEEASACPCS